MAQKKAFEVDKWLARPDPSVRIILLYGPDRGLVSERARIVVAGTGLPAEDPFSVIRLDASLLDQSPGRLENEARTVPMFAGKRLIWVGNAGAQKALSEDVKRLIDDPATDTLVLVEASDLKRGTSLRAIVEAAPNAMALPCFQDDRKAVDLLIDDELGKAGLTISLEAREAVRTNLGGDRLASRGEMAKLCLYCMDARQIGIEDVRAIMGDASSVSVDEVVDAVLAGRSEALDVALSRHSASGAPLFLVLNAALRQFQTLQAMREAIDQGNRSAAAVVAAARPPVFFSRRALVESALKTWSVTMIMEALNRLQGAVLQSRKHPQLAEPIVRQSLLILSRLGGKLAG